MESLKKSLDELAKAKLKPGEEEALTQEKEITIAKSASYQFTVTGTAADTTVETATDVVSITAVDPSKVVALSVTATVDKPTVYVLPAVVK